MEDDECPVYLPDVAIKWNLILFSNPFSKMYKSDGKNLDTWYDFLTLFKYKFMWDIQKRQKNIST